MSKMARDRCAKHICKSKCEKTDGLRPLLEGRMSKNGTPLWRQAHLQVKMYKTHVFWTAFGGSDVEKVPDRRVGETVSQLAG